jgi:hypothetical protein
MGIVRTRDIRRQPAEPAVTQPGAVSRVVHKYVNDISMTGHNGIEKLVRVKHVRVRFYKQNNDWEHIKEETFALRENGDLDLTSITKQTGMSGVCDVSLSTVTSTL